MPGQWPGQDAISDDRPQVRAGGSFFTTLGNWAATLLNPANLLTIPQRLFKCYWQQHRIVAVPVIGSNGSNKKRFIDAGLLDTSSPSTRAHAHALVTRRRFNQTPATALSPDMWSPSPEVSKFTPLSPPQFTSPLVLEDVCEDPWIQAAADDEQIDDSLEFSFSGSDVLTSTPPRNPLTGSPAPLSWDSPQFQSPAVQTSPTPATKTSKLVRSPQLSTALSRGSQHSIRHHGLESGFVTPMRRFLLKLQLRESAGSSKAQDNVSPDANIAPIYNSDTVSDNLVSLPEASSLLIENDAESLSYDSDVSSSQFQCDIVSSPFQSHAESSQFQPNVDISPTRYTPQYENDLSFLSDASPSRQRKTVRWTQHAGAKPFYVDEKVSEMLDSTLQTITSSPVKPFWEEYDETEDVSKDDIPNLSLPTPSPSVSFVNIQTATHSQDSGFHGVPADTWDCSEDSLDESQISVELLEDLQADLQTKLALAPSPSPPAPCRLLVEPLGSDELDALEAVAKASENGKNTTFDIVKEKLNARDFATLLPELFSGDPKAWLNDNIVNEYLAILVKHIKDKAGYKHVRGGKAPTVHAFSSFWYTNMKTKPKSVERWASRFQLAGAQYLDADILLYPICDGGHWRLLAIKPKERVIEYLDSLGFNAKPYLAKTFEYLQSELKEAFNAEEWTVIQQQRSSQQLNGSDCGVFTLLNALALLRGEDAERVVACDGMADARERIAITLMAGHPTSEIE